MKELFDKLVAIIIEKTQNDDFTVIEKWPHTATAIYKDDESPDFEFQIVWWIWNDWNWFSSYDNSFVMIAIPDENIRKELFEIVCRKEISQNQ